MANAQKPGTKDHQTITGVEMKHESNEGKEMSKLYGMGWKQGYAWGFKSGLVVAAGLAFVFVMELGHVFFKKK